MILVTGATGLVGANVCQLAAERGLPVRALVREGSDPEGLAALDVEIERGDITSAKDVARAAQGVDGIVHTAALVAGIRAPESLEDSEAINVGGTRIVLDAAAVRGARTVLLSTIGILPFDRTIDEVIEPSLPMDGEIAYMTTKRRAFHDAISRPDQDVVVIFPGGVYGPSPCVKRSLASTSFNAEIVEAVAGRIDRFPALELPWVLARDVAACVLAALERGTPGARYMAAGRREDVMTVPEFLSLACETVGVGHRVATARSEDPGAVEEFGMMVAAADAGGRKGRGFFDDTRTKRALGGEFTPVRDGLTQTGGWMMERGVLDDSSAVAPYAMHDSAPSLAADGSVTRFTPDAAP
jgi:nucleoside-diphosphate-sugar epimerase